MSILLSHVTHTEWGVVMAAFSLGALCGVIIGFAFRSFRPPSSGE
jgi:ABC-type nitrate/sulfonate/bicarbonate transport system permease component